ncbi:uncharacterized protein C21orf62 homolog [Betta splendens]|uniref:Uncharacterized protein C21orf62 homolog n=1 Tax=Betta splendens TaxID=158456 RepID=A0A9W2XI11_BETSP|nr:uncharacterized protein C21orf62 homolog [Betta splendens]
MPLNVFSFAPLLWLPLLLTPVTQRADSAPTSEAARLFNTTLWFHGGAYNLRSCSCYAPVRDCDEALANTLCRCHTVPLSALPDTGVREPGRLVIWVKETWVLEKLLKRGVVGHLQLSFCGTAPVKSQCLALVGLQTLQVHNTAAEVPFSRQEITVSPAAKLTAELEGLFSSSIHVSILDTAVLKGVSALKAYTVVRPPAASLSQHIRSQVLPLALTQFVTPDNSLDSSEHEPLHNLLITFIY